MEFSHDVQSQSSEEGIHGIGIATNNGLNKSQCTILRTFPTVSFAFHHWDRSRTGCGVIPLCLVHGLNIAS